MIVRACLLLTMVFGVLHAAPPAAAIDLPAGLDTLVAFFKRDPRGPYKSIRWFCTDGRLLAPPAICGDTGSIQRATYGDAATALQRTHNLWLGQILAGSDSTQFLDSARDHSRFKQYALEMYLRDIDDGWVLRKARFYRGAIQVEDELAWGRRFILWLFARNEYIRGRFLLCREAARVIPHRTTNRTLEQIRVISKNIGDSLPSFSDMRIKLHGQPDRFDIERLATWRQKNGKRLSDSINVQLNTLDQLLRKAFSPTISESLDWYINRLSSTSPLRAPLEQLRKTPIAQPALFCSRAADILALTRKNIANIGKSAGRAFTMDLSLELERLMFTVCGDWTPATLGELIEKCRVIASAAASCGYLETAEWDMVESDLVLPPDSSVTPQDLARISERFARIVEWGSSNVTALYERDQARFVSFEPLAAGFIDDLLRSSILLPLGNSVAQLADLQAFHSGRRNTIAGVSDAQRVRGINPGYAKAKLEVLGSGSAPESFAADRIYLMDRPPPTLKPVAGLGTVSEGSALSHVALLARNLAIPNAVFTSSALEQLKDKTGAMMFYAVSPRGAVTLKPASDMTTREKALFEERKGPSQTAEIPERNLELTRTDIPALSDVRAANSGKMCGPKAANLGQLSSMFPEMVAPGMVIPFGVFYEHMQQTMPGSDSSYWQFLETTFLQAQRRSDEAETFVLGRLAALREAIKSISLRPEFVDTLRRRFAEIFGTPTGKTPVFVRSDTNAEDLKDFSGAGLNLTVPNVLSEEQLLQAIRDVWASPYSERSYRWRQRFLRNPVQVYPSILVQRSVDCDKSGVIITTGLHSHDTSSITVSFSRGFGGAVDAQAAESYELSATSAARLYNPAREPSYHRLNRSGGTVTLFTSFEKLLLSKSELERIHSTATTIKQRLPAAPGIESSGPFDIELGFKDDTLFLFQARPFVENKKAQGSEYLRSLDIVQSAGTPLPLHTPLAMPSGGQP